ncbi:MAG: (4Fe-4S)-binding protein, partial [Flavobacteriaceae bacterium]
MGEREIVKEYSNGELTVVWKPKKCIHSAVCVKTLPEVYDPQAKPWIKAENASTEALKSQIDKCPSAALTYYMNDGSDKEETIASGTKVEVAANGPLLVHGTLEVKDADGN